MNEETTTEIVPRASDGIAETATTAQAAQAEAIVKARFAIARRFMRTDDDVRTSLVRECQRPTFAEVARYRRPVGKKKNDETGEWEEQFAEGFSIRFAEAAGRYMKNIDYGSTVLFDDDDKRIVRAYAYDLETNFGGSKDLTLAKVVERRQLKRNQTPLRTRRNSFGEAVYIVRAEESEFAVREAAEVSKALRTLLLRLVPGWILDACEHAVAKTLADEHAKDPDEARRKLVDSFASIGVKAADLTAFVGHDLTALSPAEHAQLRAVYATIKDGEASWNDIVATRGATDDEQKADPKVAATTEKVKQKVEQLRNKGKPAAAPAQAPQPSGAAPTSKAEPREPGSDG